MHGFKQTRSSVLKALVFSVFLGFFSNFLQLGIPAYSMQIFDRILPSGHLATLVVITVILIFAIGGAAVLESCRASILGRAATKLGWLVETASARSETSPRKSGQADDAQTVALFLIGPLAAALCDAPWSLIYMLALASIHHLIAIYALLSVAVMLGFTLLNSRFTRSGKTRSATAHSQAETFRLRMTSDPDVVRCMGISSGLMNQWRGAQKRYVVARGAAADRQAWADGAMKALRSVSHIGILALTTWLAIRQSVNPGAIVASAMIFARALSPVERLAPSQGAINGAYRSWKRLGEAESCPAAAKPMVMPSIEGHVRLTSVAVLLPGRRPALEGINLQFAPGTLTIIVGSEGAGKSTLVRVLSGGLAPSRGQVTLYGMSYDNYDEHQLGAQIGYMPETPSLKSGSIADVISRYSRKDDPRIVEAAQTAGADEFIRQLPRGYQTELGGDSKKLSAGQMQRLALARAVYGRPRLLVLDEPMSALDNDGENKTIAVITDFKAAGSTVVAVLRSAQFFPLADRVIYLDQGRLRLFVGHNDIKDFLRLRLVSS